MQLGLMVEGQNGLTWDRWRHIVRLADRLGFPSLFRSDHYFIGPQQDSLEAYLSFVIAATESERLRFGPLVSPVTFRRPVDVGRMAAQIDVLSGGRFVMGLGAGWNEAEHGAYGLPFPPIKERFDRLEEAIQLMQAMWESDDASFSGEHYRIAGVDVRPRPSNGGPPILIGGGGERRTLKLVAQYASEWNAVMLTPEQYRAKTAVLEQHCEAVGRDPAEIGRSMMMFGLLGPDALIDDATQRLMQMFAPGQADAKAFREGFKERGAIVGGTDEVVDTLGRLAEAGLQEIQFQHFFFDRDEIPEYLAGDLAPKVAAF